MRKAKPKNISIDLETLIKVGVIYTRRETQCWGDACETARNLANTYMLKSYKQEEFIKVFDTGIWESDNSNILFYTAYYSLDVLKKEAHISPNEETEDITNN